MMKARPKDQISRTEHHAEVGDDMISSAELACDARELQLQSWNTACSPPFQSIRFYHCFDGVQMGCRNAWSLLFPRLLLPKEKPPSQICAFQSSSPALKLRPCWWKGWEVRRGRLQSNLWLKVKEVELILYAQLGACCIKWEIYIEPTQKSSIPWDLR